jgi:hypothetical protein
MEDDTLTLLNRCFENLSTKDVKIANIIKQAIESYKDSLSIDQSLLDRLKDLALAHKSPIITGDQYSEMIQSINNNSIIVYFKSADVFRVYDGSQISSELTNHLNSDFRKNKQMYEVIPNHLPQKIILLCDKGIVSRMDSIKNYLIEYMKSKGVADIKNSDINTFENDSGMVEIMINGFYVENFDVREKVVSGLMKYIDRKERNNVITSKMKSSEYNPFDDSQLISMPNCKKQLNGNCFDLVNMLIRNLDNCRNLSNGNVYITINQTNNIDTYVNGDVVNITSKDDESVEFINYIKQNKPTWYKEGKYMNKELLLEKYEKQFGSITKARFHNIFYQKLFGENRRDTKNNKRFLSVKVKMYDEL